MCSKDRAEVRVNMLLHPGPHRISPSFQMVDFFHWGLRLEMLNQQIDILGLCVIRFEARLGLARDLVFQLFDDGCGLPGREFVRFA